MNTSSQAMNSASGSHGSMIRLAAFLGGTGASLPLLDMTPVAGNGIRDLQVQGGVMHDPSWRWAGDITVGIQQPFGSFPYPKISKNNQCAGTLTPMGPIGYFGICLFNSIFEEWLPIGLLFFDQCIDHPCHRFLKWNDPQASFHGICLFSHHITELAV